MSMFFVAAGYSVATWWSYGPVAQHYHEMRVELDHLKALEEAAAEAEAEIEAEEF